MGFFESLEVIDYLRSGALIIGFLATVFADKKGESTIWLQADALAGAAFGVALYLFPNVLLEYQVTIKYDWMIDHLLRIIGASLIAKSLLWYHTSGTKDRAVSGIWLFTRATTGGTVFMLMYIFCDLYKDSKLFTFKNQLCSFGLLACFLWTSGNLIHLFRENSFGTIRKTVDAGNRLTTHVLVHVLTVGIASVVTLTHPEYIMSLMVLKGVTVNAFHIHLLTISNAIIMITCMFPVMSLPFTNEKDKKAFFKAYLWVMLFVQPWALVYYWKGLFTFTTAGLAFESLFLVAMLNALCAVGCLSGIPGISSVCGFLNLK